MKKLFFFSLLLLYPFSMNAHPSWAFIIDQHEKIYLVDLTEGDGTLMQINLKTEQLKVLATGFHCHSMQLGKDGHIYAGLNIWRQGEIEGEGHNYLIRINTVNGRLDTLLFSDRYLNYFGGDIAMSQDLSNVYYTYKNHIYAKKLPNQPTLKLLDHTFKRASTIALDEKGDLWIADTREKDGTLYRWNQQKGLRTYATGLIPAKPSAPVFKDRRHHIFYGIGFNKKGDPMVTESADRKVMEISFSGQKRLIYQSPKHWHPLMAFHHNDKYYVLENGWKIPFGYQGMKIQVLDEKLEKERTYVINTKKQKLEVIAEVKKGSIKPIQWVWVVGLGLLVIGIVFRLSGSKVV